MIYTQVIPTTEPTIRPGNMAVILNILLVDDNENDLLPLEEMLKHESRNIIKVNNGKDALRIISEKEIAIILLDVQMPNMSGYDVARILKENPKTKDIAIIFITAMTAETMNGYEQGAVDFLHKPLDINLTKAKVQVFEKLYRQRIEVNNYVNKIEQINKQLDEFVYIVSHDLKAPLRGLSSLGVFLEEELGTDMKPGVKELVDMIKSRTVRMQVLIDGILHYSRVANCKTEKDNVNTLSLIHNIIDLIEVPSNIRFEIQDNLPVLFAEKIKLHEVFQNLITNSIKYNDKPNGFLKIKCTDNGNHYEFSFEDNGIGIPKEFHEKIFGVFQCLNNKNKQESTGIGLTIVKKIIEEQQGKVWLKSEVGIGTTFYFTWNK